MDSKKTIFGKKKNENGIRIEGSALHIDCGRCVNIPNPASSQCIACITSCIGRFGSVESIVLHTSRDMEISGQAAEILCDLAVLDRSVSEIRGGTGKRCRGCSYSPANVMNVIWEGFPEPRFESAREALLRFRPDSTDCESCLQRTYRILDQTELGMNNIAKKARTGRCQ